MLLYSETLPKNNNKQTIKPDLYPNPEGLLHDPQAAKASLLKVSHPQQASSGSMLSPVQLENFLDGCGHPLQGEPAGFEGKGPPQLLFLVDIQRTRTGWPVAL